MFVYSLTNACSHLYDKYRMRYVEFISEAQLTASELVKHQGRYLLNLIKKIENHESLMVAGKYQKKYGSDVVLQPSSARLLKNVFFPGGNPDLAKISASGNLITPSKVGQLSLEILGSGWGIPLGALEKTPDIKGKDADYNIGDIGEISIAIAVFARFENQGQPISLNHYLDAANRLDITHSKSGSSGQAIATGKVSWPTGKEDVIEMKAVLPRRSMDFVNTEEFLSGEIAQGDVIGTIKSAIIYANQNKKVTAGIDMVSKNPETNKIRITCDGVSDQKGTKADIIMDIDGNPVNIVSAKVGRSQLGQASGHVFDKQISFFKTVFGVDVAKYNKQWGTSLEDHDRVLQAIWNEINPGISAAFAGDNTNKEMPMVKQLANGLIKYSNNAAGDVDIVKLVSSAARPGYKLLRIDANLHAALEKVNLVARPGAKGVSIYGKYNGKDILLMKARSYLSQGGNTVRTIIEGGDLLDILAEVVDEK